MRKFHDLKNYLDEKYMHECIRYIEPSHPFDDHVSDVMRYVYEVHDEEYIEKLLDDRLTHEEKRRIGLDFNEHLIHRTFSETGGTVLTADLACQFGLACNLAGGTHHAHRGFGSGFTIVNDMAVAAHRAVSKGLARKVLIFDCDVHQGDGTATIFSPPTDDHDHTPRDRDRMRASQSIHTQAHTENKKLAEKSIFTVSIHCQENFPLRKAESDLDVGLPSGTSDSAYMYALRETFEMALELCGVQAGMDGRVQLGEAGMQDGRDDAIPRVPAELLVIYDAGVDIARDDKLGRLDISDEGIYERDHYVLNECVERGIPVCGVIGGGYDPSPSVLAGRHGILHTAAIDVWRRHMNAHMKA